MANLNLDLKAVEDDTPSVECEYPSLNQMMGKEAHLYTLCKQGLAYHVMCNQEIIGGCMVKLIMIRLNDNGTEYRVPACEIPYLVLKESKRGKKFIVRRRKMTQEMTIGEYIMWKLIQQIRAWAEQIPIRCVVIEAIKDKEKRLQSWYERKFHFREYHRVGKGTEHLDNVSMKLDLVENERDADFPSERTLPHYDIQFGMLHDYDEEFYVKPHELDFPMCFARRRPPGTYDERALEALRTFLDWLETVPVRFFMMEFFPDLRDWYRNRGLQEYQGVEYPNTMYKDFINLDALEQYFC